MSIAHSIMLLVTLVFVLTTRGIALDLFGGSRRRDGWFSGRLVRSRVGRCRGRDVISAVAIPLSHRACDVTLEHTGYALSGGNFWSYWTAWLAFSGPGSAGGLPHAAPFRPGSASQCQWTDHRARPG